MANDQISKEAERLGKIINGVSQAVAEQAASVKQIVSSSISMKKQAEQASKAMNEQTKAVREISTAGQNISKQVKMISRANKEHSSGMNNILSSLADMKKITDQNVMGVEENSKTFKGLRINVKNITELMEAIDLELVNNNQKS
jgi:methyl-accepting chemotaxis protein